MLLIKTRVSSLEDEVFSLREQNRSQQSWILAVREQSSSQQSQILALRKQNCSQQSQILALREQILSQAIRVDAVYDQNSRLLEQIAKQQWQELSILKLKGRTIATIDITEKSISNM